MGCKYSSYVGTVFAVAVDCWNVTGHVLIVCQLCFNLNDLIVKFVCLFA